MRAAGGDVAAEQSVKPWELPKWVIARARELGLQLDPDAARALVAHVGERQQRLLRELEKLAAGIRRQPVESTPRRSRPMRRHRPSAAPGRWPTRSSPATRTAASRLYLALRAQGERLPGLIYWMAQRVRTAHEVAEALEAGEPAAQVKRRLRMPSRAADRLIADARRAGAEQLRRAIEQIADLELDSRGGGRAGGASEDTAALLAIQRIAQT